VSYKRRLGYFLIVRSASGAGFSAVLAGLAEGLTDK
jgi:hypothetical protein